MTTLLRSWPRSSVLAGRNPSRGTATVHVPTSASDLASASALAAASAAASALALASTTTKGMPACNFLFKLVDLPLLVRLVDLLANVLEVPLAHFVQILEHRLSE